MKTIDIAMVAWPWTPERLGYMTETLRSIREFVTAPGFDIRLRVSLETVDVSTHLFTEARKACAEYEATPHWRGKLPSLAGNMNDALMLGHGDYILLTQDDWPWQGRVDIAGDCDVLERNTEFSFIRYATFYTELKDGVHFQVSNKFGVQFLCPVNMSGPYPYGDQPHLRRKDFATRRSATGGAPIGFYVDPGPEAGEANYSTPENEMQVHLVKNGWQIAAYSPNVVAHNGCLSTDPARQPQEAAS